ncbi:hypothetical protein [Planococcus koreensis]|uniref:hypothetical protein n=1 Tax=Planococcus koreensis TaxID=112331 RepID=UPI0039FD4842
MSFNHPRLLDRYEDEKRIIHAELKTLAFWSFKNAESFVDDMPNMSALDLQLLMNGNLDIN